jgi:hypothetical protein
MVKFRQTKINRVIYRFIIQTAQGFRDTRRTPSTDMQDSVTKMSKYCKFSPFLVLRIVYTYKVNMLNNYLVYKEPQEFFQVQKAGKHDSVGSIYASLILLGYSITCMQNRPEEQM